ncbi:MAG: glycosyltransferase family 2 protein [Pseudomonadales bacterium]
MTPVLSIILPCYNEEEVLPESSSRLITFLESLISKGKVSSESRLFFIDDGSSDNTWTLIEQLNEHEPLARGLKLARNFGHQRAVLAGLLEVPGDLLISMDVDLQDDIEAIEKMVDTHLLNQADVVYGVRDDRSSDSVFKRSTAEGFYKLLNLLGVEVVANHADFRLMSRKVVESFRQFGESNLFLRGLVPLVGYKSDIVYYERAERFAGTSKYPLRKMLALAVDGVTSMSVVPLRLISSLGLLIFLVSTLMIIWITLGAVLTDIPVPGWASTVLPIYFIGGVQLLCTGTIGEYIGKIYLEVKNRPRYIIEKTTD